MKNLFRSISIVAFTLLLNTVSAQNVVNVSVFVAPTPSPFVKDMIGNKGLVTFTLTNTSANPVTGKLLGNANHNGKKISETTLSSTGIREFTIAPGASVTKFADEILNFSEFDFGDFASIVIRSGVLPAGNYNGCVQFYNTSTNLPVSAEQCFNTNVTDYSAPELFLPANDELLTLPINTFSWSRLNPTYPGGISYTLKIWELYEGDVPAAVIKYDNNVVAKIENIFTESTPLNMFQLNLQEDRNYMWAVQAFNSTGEKITNQSVPRFFKYGTNYSSELVAHIKLLELHEELIALYLDVKKQTECEVATENNAIISKDSLQRQTLADKWKLFFVSVGSNQKKLEKIKTQTYEKINAVQAKMDQLIVANNFLSEFQANVKALPPVKEKVFGLELVSNALANTAFGEKLKTKINQLKPGAYENELLDINKSCDELLITEKQKTKQPILNKEQKKEAKETEYLLALANSCNASARVLEQASNNVKDGVRPNQEYDNVRGAGFVLYTKYLDVIKHVSKERLAETKNQQGVERLKEVFTKFDRIRKNKKEELSDTEPTVKKLEEAAILFRGGDLELVKIELASRSKKTITKTIELSACFFTKVKATSSSTENGLETTFAWEQKDGSDKVKILWNEVNNPSEKSEKEVVNAIKTVTINLKGDVEYEVTLVAYKEDQEIDRTSSIGKASLSSTTFKLGCNSALTHTSNVEEEVKLTREEICNFFAGVSIDAKDVTNNRNRNSYYYYDRYESDYPILPDPYKAKEYALKFSFDKKVGDINYVYYPANNPGSKKGPSYSYWSGYCEIGDYNGYGYGGSSNINANTDYIIVFEGKENNKSVGEIFVKFYIDQDGKPHYFTGCTLEEVANKSFEKAEYKPLSECFFNNMRTYTPSCDGCWILGSLPRFGFTWFEYGDVDEVIAEVNYRVVSLEHNIDSIITIKETLRKGTKEFTFTSWGGRYHTISFTAYKDGKVIEKISASGKSLLNCKFNSCDDKAPPVVDQTLASPPKVIDCFFSNVESTGEKRYGNVYDNTFTWKQKQEAAYVKVFWHEAQNKNAKGDMSVAKSATQVTIPLQADSDYKVYLKAYDANFYLIGETSTEGKVNAKTSTFQLGCDPVPAKVKEVEPEVKKVANKDECYFTSVTVTRKAWANLPNTFDYYIAWESDKTADKLEASWYGPNSTGEAGADGIKVFSEKDKTVTLTLDDKHNYSVLLHAYKGGKRIAMAGTFNIAANVESGLSLLCQKATGDDITRGNEIKPSITKKKEPEVKKPEVNNCYFNNITSTQSGSGVISNTFKWTPNGLADKVKIKWNEANNPDAKAEQDVTSGQSTTTIKLQENTDYVVTLVSYNNNNNEIAKATATGKVTSSSSTINLACVAVPLPTAIPPVENCFFRNMESSTVKKTDKVYEHTFKWEELGNADKLELIGLNREDWNDQKKVEIAGGVETGKIELNKGTQYWVALVAYKDGKIFARADNLSVDGGEISISLPCNPTSANTASKVVVKNCFFSDFETTRSQNLDAWGRYEHTIKWKRNGEARDILITMIDVATNEKFETYTGNKDFRKFDLQKDKKYTFTLEAKDNDVKTIATAKSYPALGKESTINFACTEESANTASLRYEDKCVAYDIKTSKKIAQANEETENEISLILKPGYDSYILFVRNVDNASEVYKVERRIPSAEKLSGKNYNYPNTTKLKNNAKYIAELYVYKGDNIIASAISQPTLGSADFALTCDDKPATAINSSNYPPAVYEGMNEKCAIFDMVTSAKSNYHEGRIKSNNEISFKLKPGVGDSYKLVIQGEKYKYLITKNYDTPWALTAEEKAYQGAVIIKTNTSGLYPFFEYKAYLFVYKNGKVVASAVSDVTKGDGDFKLTCKDGLAEPEYVAPPPPPPAVIKSMDPEAIKASKRKDIEENGTGIWADMLRAETKWKNENPKIVKALEYTKLALDFINNFLP